MNSTPSSSSSFEQLWGGLNSGDQEAARKLYERFVDQLIRLATTKLKYQLGSNADPESVAQSVFQSFFEGLQRHQFEARSWGMVFGLLSHITFRKCLKRKRAEMQARRNPGTPVSPLGEFEAAAGSPGPAEQAMVKELLETALAGFDANELVMINTYMEGQTTDTVAQKVGLTARTVQRVIEKFRTRLEQLLTNAE